MIKIIGYYVYIN